MSMCYKKCYQFKKKIILKNVLQICNFFFRRKMKIEAEEILLVFINEIKIIGYYFT